MKNSSKSLDTDLQDIDLLLEISAAGAKVENTQDLQSRIVTAVSEMPLPTQKEKPTNAGYLHKFGDWFSLPVSVSAAALAFALILAVILWPLGEDVVSPPEYQLAESTQPIQAEEVFDFSVLSVQETELEVYDELIWDELLLAEDELAFAML